MPDEIELQDLLQLYYDNFNYVEWERYDFVDPPYVWNVSGHLEVGGYVFEIDGDETVGCGYEAREITVTTPSGKTHQLL